MRHGWVVLFGLLFSCRDQAAETTLNRATAEVKLDPAVLDFGPTAIGSQKTRIISLTNSRRARLNICPPGSNDAACPISSSLSVSDQTFGRPRPDMWWVVEAAETKKFTVLFAPKTAGDFSATITLGHDAGEPVQIPITGSGVAPDLVFGAAQIELGEVHLLRRVRRELEVTNRSGVEVELSVRLSTGSAAAFSIGAPSLLIPADTSTAITVFYAPLEEQTHSGARELRYCPNCSVTIPLGGKGIKPLIRVTPATMDFGSHDDETAPALTLSLDSIGQSALTIRSVLLVAGSPREFEVSPSANLPMTLSPGQNFPVQVVHRGDSPGVDVARIEISSDAWDDPATQENESLISVGLVAESLGPEIEVDGEDINFGTTRVGNFNERLVSVSNRGNGPLTISRVEISGPLLHSIRLLFLWCWPLRVRA